MSRLGVPGRVRPAAVAGGARSNNPIALPPTRRRRFGRLRRPWGILAGLVLTALAAAGWIVWNEPGRTSGAAYNRGANGLWLAHTWIEDPHSDAEIADLAERLRRAQIRDIFVHVGPLTERGTIAPDRYPAAAEFTRRLKAAGGGSPRIFAWIGQVESRGGGVLDLSAEATRREIAATAAGFPQALGFDGIHYDIEPILDGDARFLQLLEETRRAAPGRPLSVATGKWAPDGPIGWLGKSVAPGSALWTSVYYREVARRVDQIVPMLYDTGTRPGPLYRRVVALELAGILQASRDTGATVLAGVPTYNDRTVAHDPASENLAWALPGVVGAVESTGNPSHFGGVALYADWQTSAEEWATYGKLWIGSDPDRP